MKGEGGIENALLYKSLNPYLRLLPLSVGRRRQHLVNDSRPLRVREVRVLFVASEEPVAVREGGLGYRSLDTDQIMYRMSDFTCT